MIRFNAKRVENANEVGFLLVFLNVLLKKTIGFVVFDFIISLFKLKFNAINKSNAVQIALEAIYLTIVMVKIFGSLWATIPNKKDLILGKMIDNRGEIILLFNNI